ncbi:metallophosphoesterase [Spirosoma sp. KUDC1026]|uniref:metallophosphoesterase n=1 Tax=Spirosoma sp. KUDC1026 TaxID=2745947 RepID=UPI00159B9001|nr:metallophosphoesterase [Spirosoma sp. KUDC1026]QKZ15272.1 metallophosphoesterase [Spirosoma sp. KUDC1026]
MKSSRYLVGLLCLLTGLTTYAQTLTRGPYLQVVTPTSVQIRWRTSQPTIGRVWFGPTASQLTNSQRETQPTQEHMVTITGLQPATRYAYAIGQDETKLASGADYYVQTAIPTGDKRPFRIWALGDFGDGSENQRNVYKAFRNATANRPADLWLWLGDNAYCCGTDDQFQQYVFSLYGPNFRNTPFFMTPGNHDYADNSNNFNIDYYKLFSMPQRGESGGVPSGSQAYFSADYGNVHMVSLDSQGNEAGLYRLYDTTGTQVQWLKRDLAANKQPWTIVFFHHPPYSKGGHDSDTELAMKLIRERLTPILERYKVDLVMNGHSHNYERLYRIKNHRGLANTFDRNTQLAEGTTARYDGTPNSCPVLTKGEGIVYVVNGSGGALGPQQPDYPLPAMVAGTKGTAGGSVILDVSDNRIDAQFIAADGVVQDQFTIMKEVSKTASITSEYGDTLQLAASWPVALDKTGDYKWSSGESSRTIRYVANRSGTFPITVSDSRQCLTDQYTVTVQAQPRLTTKAPASACAGKAITVTATPENTTKAAGWQYDVLLSDAAGNFISEQVIGSGSLSSLQANLPATLAAGSGYRLRIRPRNMSYAELIPSEAIAISVLPTATITGSATVTQGQSATLLLNLTGSGPWRGTLSDGTAYSATASPTFIAVQPGQSTQYTITSVENGCGVGTGSGQALVTVLIPTEVEPFAGGQLRVFPNPTQDVVYVELSIPQRKEIAVNLRDVQGRTVYQKQTGLASQFKEAITLPEVNGTYLLTIQVGKEVITRKVLRQ